MSTALEEVAEVAEQTAQEQRRLARWARSLQRQRDRGGSWGSILEAERAAGIVQFLSHSAHRLVRATSRFREQLVAELVAEGWTRRQIGARLGVSHQRVSAMVARAGDRARGR